MNRRWCCLIHKPMVEKNEKKERSLLVRGIELSDVILKSGGSANEHT